MIVEFRADAHGRQVADVRDRIAAEPAAHVHEVDSQGCPVLVVLGAGETLAAELRLRPGVQRVVPAEHPFELAARAFRPEGTVVHAGGVPIGDGGFTVAAGPCAVETPALLAEAADAVQAAGAPLLRGGAYKPRTSPYSFQGLGGEGLQLLQRQRFRTGLRVITEVMDPGLVDLVSGSADVLQIGARNMQNFPLLRAVGLAGRPVLLKRGLAATIEEFLMAAEHIIAAGNPNVILCERGIRTFEPATRFTLDLSAVAILKQISSLPVMVDPSHAAGRASIVPALSLAAAAAGADGLLIDVHPDPAQARCDGAQAISPAALALLMDDLRRHLAADGRKLTAVDDGQDVVAVTR